MFTILSLCLGAALGACMGLYAHHTTVKEVPSDKKATLLGCAIAGALGWLISTLTAADILHALLYGLLFTLLTAVAVIDWRIFEIPNGVNLAILALGAVQLAMDLGNWKLYIIGMFSVSLLFLVLWAVTKGAGLGMGDVKLMAAAGLLLGWPRTVLAMLLGCILGSVIHLIRMRGGEGKRLAFGPYLSAGIMLAAWWGNSMILAYLSLFGL